MAKPTFITAGVGSSGSSPLTFSFNNTSGNFLAVSIRVSHGTTQPSVTAVTYDGASLFQQKNKAIPGAFAQLSIWTRVGVSTGAHNLVVTATPASSISITAGVMAYSGVSTPTSIGNTTSNSSASATHFSGSLSLGTSSIIVGGAALSGGGTLAPDANTNDRYTAISFHHAGDDLTTNTLGWTTSPAIGGAFVAVEVLGVDTVSPTPVPLVFSAPVLSSISMGGLLKIMQPAQMSFQIASPDLAQLHRQTTLVADQTKFGRFVSFAMEHEGDGPNAEIHAIEYDFRLRHRRKFTEF